MYQFKNRPIIGAWLAMLLTACGGDEFNEINEPQVSLPIKFNSIFSATYLQSIQQTGASTIAVAPADFLQAAPGQIQSKRYDGKMEVTNIITSEKQVFDWPITQNIDSAGNVESISHRALTLKPGRYDFVLLLTSQALGAQQYVAKALGQEIVHAENPEINFVLVPNLGENINSFDEVKYLSTLKFSWEASNLAALSQPQFGLSMNNGDEEIYTINKQTGIAELTMHVIPGPYKLALNLYDGDLMIAENANDDNVVNLIEGQDVQMDIISLQADISINLDPLQQEGKVTFIVPKAVVDEVGEAQDLALIVRLTDGKSGVQEKMLPVLDENGIYKARGSFNLDGLENVSTYLAFHPMADADSLFANPPIASCNTHINVIQNQTLGCALELKRSSVITTRLLGTLMLSVLDENNQSAIGTSIYMNGKLIGLTGEQYSTGSIKTHQVAGNYKITAKKNTHSASSEVQIVPLELVNELLHLLPSEGGETLPDFSFSDIAVSTAAPSQMKLAFSWNGNAEGITYTVCMADLASPNNCKAMASVVGKNQLDVQLKSVHLIAKKEFFIQASKGAALKDSNKRQISTIAINSLIQYIKASNTHASAHFGSAIALSSDGNTLAVGAMSESTHATGIHSNIADNAMKGSGAVYVFKKGAEGWLQHAYIKASNTQIRASFGFSLSLSADGNTLAVGANRESSNAQTINGVQDNTLAERSGAVYIYQQEANQWQQQAYIKSSNSETGDSFGTSVSISADGNTLAVGAYSEDSNAIGVNGAQSDNSRQSSGAAYVFKRDGGNWQQHAYLKASNADVNDGFGNVLSISADGNTLAVTAMSERSNAVGINGDETDNSKLESGAVYVFKQEADQWKQQAYVKASNTDKMDYFGYAVSLSANGDWLAVGAMSEASCDKGVNGSQSVNDCTASGAVYVFNRSGSWQQQAFIKASNPHENALFGFSVSLSENGKILAVGASGESSRAIGINGDQLNSLQGDSGAAYLFDKFEDTWQQRTYIKAKNTEIGDIFSYDIVLSGDGDTLAVSSITEDSSASGVNGNHADNSMLDSGAVYLY